MWYNRRYNYKQLPKMNTANSKRECTNNKKLFSKFSYPGEERVETVHFLPLCNVGIVLSDALQSQFIHQVNLIRLSKMFSLHRQELKE